MELGPPELLMKRLLLDLETEGGKTGEFEKENMAFMLFFLLLFFFLDNFLQKATSLKIVYN